MAIVLTNLTADLDGKRLKVRYADAAIGPNRTGAGSA